MVLTTTVNIRDDELKPFLTFELIMVHIKETVTPYPRIDADPHFSRVVRYMRPSDYAVWGATTAAVPGGLYAWG